VVDQFDEAFTVLDDEARQRFLADLVAATAETRVMLTMRSDRYGDLAGHAELSRLVTANTYLLAPLTEDELRRAVEQPARTAELSYEDGLVDALVADARAGSGDLVPLACALRLLAGSGMTLAGYRQIGGLSGALETFGERALAAVDDRAAAERLLGRLVTSGRRTQPRADEVAAAHTLAAHGVLAVYADGVELSRDALRHGWPRLRRLVDEARTERDLRDHLSRAAAAWSAGQGEVYRGARLVAALDWGTAHAKELTQVEHDFLTAGRRLLLAEEQRRRRTVDRLRRWLVVLVLAVVAAVAVAAIAVVQQTRTAADAERADARRLAALAATEPDLRLALLLAVAATRLDPSAGSAIAAALDRSPDLIAVVGEGVTAVADGPEADTLALAYRDGTIRLVDARTLRDRGAALAYPDGGPVRGLAFTPDGRKLVSWGGAGDGAGIVVWDVASRRLEGAPFGQASPDAGGLLADGVTLLVGHREAGEVVAWSIEARTPSTAYEFPSGRVEALAVTPDGRLVALGTSGGTTVFEPRTGEVTRLSGARNPSSLSPDGRTLLIVRGGDIEIWNVADRDRRAQARRHAGDVVATTWSPDGQFFASVGADGLAIVWDAGEARPVHVFTGHAGPVALAGYTPDGQALVTVGRDGVALVWDLTGTRGVGARAATGDARALACAVVGRDMTRSEWERVLPDRPYRHVCPM
jgi:WD40 repeat protein